MSQAKEKLMRCLLGLADGIKQPEQNLPLSAPANQRSLTAQDDVIAQLPRSLARQAAQIIDLFEQVDLSNRQLTEELLRCYEQLNIAFSVPAKVTGAKTVQQALLALVRGISRAVDSRFDIYLGPLAPKFSLPPDQVDLDKNVVYSPAQGDKIITARDFLRQHETALQTLVEAKTDRLVSMIGNRNVSHHDSDGKGDVLALRLVGGESGNEDFGTLLFVRSEDQAFFAAADMNLGASLAQMGSAVIGNVIFAQKLQEASIQTIASLVRATEAKDPYTSGHSTRVAEMACRLWLRLGYDPQQVKILQWAGLLHDIGKIGIKDEVLSKTGKLTEEEFAHIKSHPVKSYQVLKPVLALQDILPAVKHHHEHFDGSGYPDGLKGSQIPLHARILQIADVWDALTSTRSYRAAMTTAEAMEIMRAEAGTTMDPELVASFLEMMQQNIPTDAKAF